MKKLVFILVFILTMMLLSGCAKTASESAADAALVQVGAVEQAIKKECPQAKIGKDMDALRATITSQLKTCEAEQARIQADKVKWQTAFFAMLVVMGVYFGSKAKIL